MSRHTIVLNEWIIYDLLGENGSENQKEAKRFMDELIKRCDKIAILRGSPWMLKAYKLMGQDDPLIRGLSKQLHLGILRDPDKARILETEEVEPLPREMENLPEEDHYLVQTYLASEAKLLVTTDETLKDALSKFRGRIKVKLRDEFLAKYLQGHAPR